VGSFCNPKGACDSSLFILASDFFVGLLVDEVNFDEGLLDDFALLTDGSLGADELVELSTDDGGACDTELVKLSLDELLTLELDDDELST